MSVTQRLCCCVHQRRTNGCISFFFIFYIQVLQMWVRHSRHSAKCSALTLMSYNDSLVFLVSLCKMTDCEWEEVWFTWSVSVGDRAVGQLQQGQHTHRQQGCHRSTELHGKWQGKASVETIPTRLAGGLSMSRMSKHSPVQRRASSPGCGLSELSRKRRQLFLKISKNFQALVFLQTELIPEKPSGHKCFADFWEKSPITNLLDSIPAGGRNLHKPVCHNVYSAHTCCLLVLSTCVCECE